MIGEKSYRRLVRDRARTRPILDEHGRPVWPEELLSPDNSQDTLGSFYDSNDSGNKSSEQNEM